MRQVFHQPSISPARKLIFLSLVSLVFSTSVYTFSNPCRRSETLDSVRKVLLTGKCAKPKEHHRQVSQNRNHMWLQPNGQAGFSCLPSRLHGKCRISPASLEDSLESRVLYKNTLERVQCELPSLFSSGSTVLTLEYFTTCSQSSELTCLRVASFGTQLTMCIKVDCLEPELLLLMDNMKWSAWPLSLCLQSWP